MDIVVPFPKPWERYTDPVAYPRFPQTPLAPWVAMASARRQWDTWQQDEAVRPRNEIWRFVVPVTPPKFFVGQPAPHPWDYWTKDEAKRNLDTRFFFPQTPLASWRALAESRQACEAEGFRRVSDNGWDQFRLYWTQPVVGTPFPIYQPAAHPWDYWPGDHARRERIDAFRMFMPQTRLKPWVASQAVTWQQQGPIEFRRVSDSGGEAFLPFWPIVIPPPTPVGGSEGGAGGGGKRHVEKLVEELPLFKRIGKKPRPGDIARALAAERGEVVVAAKKAPGKEIAITPELPLSDAQLEDDTVVLLILRGLV